MKKTYVLIVKYADGVSENIYNTDEAKLYDLLDEIKADNDNIIYSNVQESK